MTDREQVYARLQQIIERLAGRRSMAHVVAGVATGDDVHWSGAAGAAGPDGAPMRPDTPFFIASVTKLYIASAILQLHEEGRLALDAPMRDYLPDELVGGLHRLHGTDHTPRITIRHLLSHTSGLPDFLEDRPRGGKSLYEDAGRGRDLTWDLDDVVRITRGLRPHFPPGDLSADRPKARYSDTGFQLLIAIIEAVTGQGFGDALTERFFGPLRMRHTYLPGRTEPALSLPATPAAVYDEDRPLDIPGVITSSNDLVSTVADQLTFGRALVRGEIFEDPATYGLMHQRFNRIGYPLQYGIGMMRFRIPGPFGPRRRPATLLGHSGATGTWLFHCPEVNVLLAGAVDQIGGRAIPFRLMPRLLRAVAAR